MTSLTPRADRHARGAHAAALAWSVVLTLLTTDALAAPEAEQMFEEGKRLMAEGKVPEACRAFERSFALEPLGGTLMGLAICHEKEGKLATALGDYHRARGVADAAGRADRVELALRSIASLEPRVPRVIVDVPASSRVAGLEVQLDGVALAPDEWNTARPVDPGTHRITWAATGMAPGSASVDAREGKRQQVSITFLAPAPPTPEDEAGMSPTTIAAVVTGASGVAALTVGAVLGIVALGDKSDSDADCDLDQEPVRCGPQGLASYESGRDLALGADIALGAGLLLVGASVILFVLPADDEATSAAQTPAARARVEGGPGRLGFAFDGRF